MKTKLCATVVLVLFQLAGINRVHAGGLVAAWGDSSYGQITLPAGVNSAWNENPKPFVWTATVDSIVAKLARCRQTLEQIQPGCTIPKNRKRMSS